MPTAIKRAFVTFIHKHYKKIAITFASVLILVGLCALIQSAAIYLVAGESAEKSKAVNDARVSLIQLVGLLSLAGGFVYSARTYALTRSTQRADRFVKAIGHIGDQDSETTRVGGVHSLRLLTVEDSRYWPVVEQILSGLIRERAKPGQPTTADIRAAVAVIGERGSERFKLDRPLDLRGAYLRGVNLVGANLEGAWLDGAVLAEADLTDARLTRARLKNADLEGAILYSAKFSEADLGGAKLNGANCYEAQMTNADVSGADLADALNLTAKQMKSMSGTPATSP